jgi:hypothetical protein
MGAKQKRFRGWCVTDHDTTKKHKNEVVEKLENDPNCVKAIVSLETGSKTEKKHLQIYVEYTNGKTMSATKKTFGGKSHLENRRGTMFEAWTYCELEVQPFYTKGEAPMEDEVILSIWDKIVVDIDNGMGEHELAHLYPSSYARYSTGILRLIALRDKRLLNTWRDIKVTYCYGPTGTGKTRHIMDMFEEKWRVHRVTNYKNPFDGYEGQDIILFEEFRSSLPQEQMLIYLDGYIPLLPCRYADKVGKYTQVFFATNISFDEQYQGQQEKYPETHAAWTRRFHEFHHIGHDSTTIIVNQ